MYLNNNVDKTCLTTYSTFLAACMNDCVYVDPHHIKERLRECSKHRLTQLDSPFNSNNKIFLSFSMAIVYLLTMTLLVTCAELASTAPSLESQTGAIQSLERLMETQGVKQEA